MEFNNTKLFIKRISPEITEAILQEYFSQYGEVIHVQIVRPKNIGFVEFSDSSMVKLVLEQEHVILGQKVEVKVAIPKVPICDRKIFVGGLPHAITSEAFRQYFEAFGNITDAAVIHNNETKTSRGFGFVTYDSVEAAKRVLENNFHRLQDKMVEVKKATPKQQNHKKPGEIIPGPGPGPDPSPSHLHSNFYAVNSQPHCATSYWPTYDQCWYAFYDGYYQQPSVFFQPYYYVQNTFHNNNHVETYNQPSDLSDPPPCADPDCQHPHCNNSRMTSRTRQN